MSATGQLRGRLRAVSRGRQHKASGIVNDPNDWSREVEDPRYLIDLLARIVTVSIETMKIVDALPPLEIREIQAP